MIIRLVCAAIAVLLPASMSVAAQRDCGAIIGLQNPMFTTPKNNDMVASCQPTGACILTAGARDQAGRVSEILFIGIDRNTKQWGVIFSSSDHQIDVAKGVSVKVGKDQPVLIPPRLLSSELDPQTIRFETKLANMLREILLLGDQSTWTYTTKQSVRVVAAFSHKGLPEAISWIACKAEIER